MRGLCLAFRAARAARLKVRAAGLGACVAKVFFDQGARGLGLVFHGAGLGRCAVVLVAVGARELSLVFRAAGLGGRVNGLGDRDAKYLFD